MKLISVYDIEASAIEKLSEKHDVTEAEIVTALLDAIEDNGIDIGEYI